MVDLDAESGGLSLSGVGGPAWVSDVSCGPFLGLDAQALGQTHISNFNFRYWYDMRFKKITILKLI